MTQMTPMQIRCLANALTMDQFAATTLESGRFVLSNAEGRGAAPLMSPLPEYLRHLRHLRLNLPQLRSNRVASSSLICSAAYSPSRS